MEKSVSRCLRDNKFNKTGQIDNPRVRVHAVQKHCRVTTLFLSFKGKGRKCK